MGIGKIRYDEKEIVSNWEKLLCKYGDKKEFDQVLKNSKSNFIGMMRYRKILMNRGFGNVSFVKLYDYYKNKKHKKLKEVLEEMFLEPISDSQFVLIINRINNTNNGLHKLYERHTEDKNLRILSIILTL